MCSLTDQQIKFHFHGNLGEIHLRTTQIAGEEHSLFPGLHEIGKGIGTMLCRYGMYPEEPVII